MNKGNDEIKNGDDIISRKAAIAKFEPWLKVEGYSEGELNMLKAVLYELTVMPSAEPKRKKGEWTNDNSCQFCGFQPWFERDIHTLSFCPHCGADMRGEQE